MPAEDGPLPLRQLLVYPVIISTSNYMALAFLHISLNALMPLFFAMPVEIGGLGFDPPTIGYVMGAYGAFTGLFQAFYFAKIIHYLGERRIFVWGMLTFLPIFTIFPIMSQYAQRFGVTPVVYAMIGTMLALMAFMDMAFGMLVLLLSSPL
jgi:hypothetical protein